MGVNETPGYNQVSEVKMDDTLALITYQDIDRIQQSCANNGSVVIINFEWLFKPNDDTEANKMPKQHHVVLMLVCLGKLLHHVLSHSSTTKWFLLHILWLIYSQCWNIFLHAMFRIIKSNISTYVAKQYKQDRWL